MKKIFFLLLFIITSCSKNMTGDHIEGALCYVQDEPKVGAGFKISIAGADTVVTILVDKVTYLKCKSLDANSKGMFISVEMDKIGFNKEGIKIYSLTDYEISNPPGDNNDLPSFAPV